MGRASSPVFHWGFFWQFHQRITYGIPASEIPSGILSEIHSGYFLKKSICELLPERHLKFSSRFPAGDFSSNFICCLFQEALLWIPLEDSSRNSFRGILQKYVWSLLQECHLGIPFETPLKDSIRNSFWEFLQEIFEDSPRNSILHLGNDFCEVFHISLRMYH